MASSTNTLQLLQVGQAGKEQTINAGLMAASPAMLFARDELGCIGLTVRLHGGAYNGAQLGAQSITLPANATRYIEADAAGVVYASAAWTDGRLRLYEVTTGPSTQTSWVDHRQAIGAAGAAAGVSSVTGSGVLNVPLAGTRAARVELTGPAFLALAGGVDGAVYDLLLSTHGHAVSWGPNTLWPGGVAGPLSGGIDTVRAVYDGARGAFLCVLYTGYAAPSASDILRLEFDEAGGATATDSSGRSHAVSLHGGAAMSAAGAHSGAACLVLDGTGYVDVTPSPDLVLAGDFTVQAWVWADPAAAAWARIAETSTYDAAGGFLLGLLGSDPVGAMRVGFQLGNTGGGGGRIDSDAALPLSQWTHVAVCVRSGTATLYVGGIPQAATMSVPALTASGLRIGATIGTPGGFFTGRVDGFRLTAGALYAGAFTPSA